jgi:hypothetical protein
MSICSYKSTQNKPTNYGVALKHFDIKEKLQLVVVYLHLKNNNMQVLKNS